MARRILVPFAVAFVVLASACSDEGSTLGGGTPAPSDTSTSPGTTPTGTTTSTAPSPTTPPTGAPPTTPPAAEPNDAAVAGIVAAHNAVRAAVSPAPATPLPQMQWSAEDAAVAKAHAAKCVFEHNAQRGPRGENIYASGGSGRTPQAVVTSWASESKNYDYATNRCSGVCGHYTQVVWRESVKVGCAAQKCTTNSPFGGGGGAWELWVCDYSPPGNSGGRKPY